MGQASAELVKSDYRFVIYDPNELPHVWRRLEPLLAKACEYSGGELTLRAVVDGVLGDEQGRGAIYGLIGIEGDDEQIAVMVVEILNLPSGDRVMWCKAAGGRDVDIWVDFDPELDAVARAWGCKRIKFQGRKGWERRLRHWKLTHVVLERDVS